MLQHVWRDLQHAARSLLHSPGFALAAIVTIALGVGVNTGIFSVLNGLLFRSLPATDAHELVSIHQTFEGVPDRQPSRLGEVSTVEYERYRDATTTLSGVLAHGDPWRLTLGGENAQMTGGLLVSCNYFDVLEQRAALGRALQASDCVPGAAIAVMIGYEFWTETFGADPSIVGRTLEVNRQLVTVVGVAPEGAYGGSYTAAFFGPISAQPLLDPADGNPARGGAFGDERTSWLSMVGRRADGASIEEVRAELAVIAAAQIDQDQPGRSTTLRVERAKPQLVPLVLFPFLAWALPVVVMTAFGLILLIACANVANLLLARATVRAREIAVRLSLGASRARIVQQLLAESVLISLAGGGLGSVLALWSFQVLATRTIPSLSPPGIPAMAVDPSPDLRVLAFTLAVTFVTALLFGLAPALRASNPNLDTVIRQDSAGAGGSRRGGKLRGVLVGAQVALCMLLMLGTGLMLRGLYATRTVDPGFRYDDVSYAAFDLQGAGYDAGEAAAFWPRLLATARSLPGIDAAAYARREPLSSQETGAGIRLPNETNAQWRYAGRNDVSPDYFSVVGIPIVRGRTFTDAELSDDARSVIVSVATAAELWPNDEPLGKILSFSTGPGQEVVALEVVGVVQDAQVTTLGHVDPRYIYLPAAPRFALGELELLVRSRLDFPATAAGLRGAVRSVDAGLAVVVSPLAANLDWWRGIASIVTTLAATAGVLALVLAAVGVYGVVAFFVSRRLREIGIRLALGASARAVLRLVVQQAIRPVAIGAVLGIAAALPASQVLSSVLFGVSPLDPLGLGGAAAFVIGVALTAGGLAARRATRVDPMVTLRHD